MLLPVVLRSTSIPTHRGEVAIRVIKANRREVPPDLPAAVWWDRVNAYQALGAGLRYWYDEVFEALTPDQLARIKAKAAVWYEYTGKYPEDISVWWEVRQARREGLLASTSEAVEGFVDYDGALHCGHCDARWSDRPERCKLCGRLIHWG